MTCIAYHRDQIAYDHSYAVRDFIQENEVGKHRAGLIFDSEKRPYMVVTMAAGDINEAALLNKWAFATFRNRVIGDEVQVDDKIEINGISILYGAGGVIKVITTGVTVAGGAEVIDDHCATSYNASFIMMGIRLGYTLDALFKKMCGSMEGVGSTYSILSLSEMYAQLVTEHQDLTAKAPKKPKAQKQTK